MTYHAILPQNRRSLSSVQAALNQQRESLAPLRVTRVALASQSQPGGFLILVDRANGYRVHLPRLVMQSTGGRKEQA